MDWEPGPLIVVDVQQAFLNDYSRHIPSRIARLLDCQQLRPLYFTRFVNTPGSPYRQILNWHECAEPPETDIASELRAYAAEAKVFTKEGFTGLPEALGSELEAQGFAHVYLVGIDTDMCVLKTALDIFDMGIEARIFADCCASTAGLQAHLSGLSVLSRNIGATQLREAGLSDGFLGAPG